MKHVAQNKQVATKQKNQTETATKEILMETIEEQFYLTQRMRYHTEMNACCSNLLEKLKCQQNLPPPIATSTN